MSDWQPAARYPDPAFVVLDPAFEPYRVSLAKVERMKVCCCGRVA